MTITTIELDTSTKEALDKMKKEKETYDAVLRRALKLDNREEIEKLMREGYSRRSKEDAKLNEEWSKAGSKWPQF